MRCVPGECRCPVTLGSTPRRGCLPTSVNGWFSGPNGKRNDLRLEKPDNKVVSAIGEGGRLTALSQAQLKKCKCLTPNLFQRERKIPAD